MRTICCANSRNNKSADWRRTGGRPFVADHAQVIAIISLRRAVDDSAKFRFIDEAHAKSDFFETGDFKSLSMFDGGNVIAGLEQTGLRAGIEPSHAAAKHLHVQLVVLEITSCT